MVCKRKNDIIEHEDYAELIVRASKSEDIIGIILVDLEDLEKVRYNKWCLKEGYAWNTKIGSSMHRYILNAPKSTIIDHINGNKLDNRKCNLRLCTDAENSYNRPANSRNILGVKGVSPVGKKFQAQICYKGKNHYLGIFDTIEKAKEAYDNKAYELFGEFSYQYSQDISELNTKNEEETKNE